MIKRMQIALDKRELDALIAMAGQDCREVKNQARFLIIAEAQRRGILKSDRNREQDNGDAKVCETKRVAVAA